MPKFTNEDKNLIKEKLDYIGIDLEHIPDTINNPIPIEIRDNLDKENRVYRYIPIDKIQIWITPKNRSLPLKDRVEKAIPLCELLDPREDDAMEKYTTFINMLNLSSNEQIEKIEEMQKEYIKAIPFEVKYDKSFLWQIYYSETNDLYYMLVPTENPEYNEMFYVIKKQIEFEKTGINSKIYAPISNLSIKSDMLKRQDINDIENYLWLFTKQWPIVYEVFDTNEEPSIQIVGETFCYEKIKSKYKNILKSKQDANEFYKLVKALFIMQTEMNYYKFKTKINECGEIHFFYNQKCITYNNLPYFIKEEYVSFCNLLNIEQEDKRKLRANLNELKKLTHNLEKEYLLKQKEISTYLQYKKSFLGKIRLFLKPKINLKELTANKNEEALEEKEIMPILKIKTEKANYTIEDLIELFNIYKKETNAIKNLKLDIEALENKNRSLKKKNENAVLYINEINEHKKSIFEFWKFTNKDEILTLDEGVDNKQNEHKLKKTFDYELDIDELGIGLDRMQRNSLSKEEQDALFLANTYILNIMNIVRNGSNKATYEDLEKLKAMLLKEKQENDAEDFDIFGGALEDRKKQKELNNTKHRETEKNLVQIMKVDEYTSIEELENIIIKKEENINEAIKKVYLPVDLPVYKIIDKKSIIKENEYIILNIDEADMMERCELSEFKLIKINLKENMKALFFTNIIYYNNKNGTLPLGMNVGKKVLIDGSKFIFNLKESQDLIIINELDEIQKIKIEEYDLKEIE